VRERPHAATRRRARQCASHCPTENSNRFLLDSLVEPLLHLKSIIDPREVIASMNESKDTVTLICASVYMLGAVIALLCFFYGVVVHAVPRPLPCVVLDAPPQFLDAIPMLIERPGVVQLKPTAGGRLDLSYMPHDCAHAAPAARAGGDHQMRGAQPHADALAAGNHTTEQAARLLFAFERTVAQQLAAASTAYKGPRAPPREALKGADIDGDGTLTNFELLAALPRTVDAEFWHSSMPSAFMRQLQQSQPP
jgi:hypothetical protein